MQTCYLTDTGKIRDHNEDSVIILNNDKGECLLAVADGMGGHKAGEVASAIVINHLTEEFYNLDSIGDKEHAIDFLRNIVTEMNHKIFEYTKEIINMSDECIFITEANLLEINKSKRYLNLYDNWKIPKNSRKHSKI